MYRSICLFFQDLKATSPPYAPLTQVTLYILIDESPMLLRDLNGIYIDAVLEPALGLGDGDVVGAHLALAHEAVLREGPVLEAVGAPPLPLGIVPLVPELHGDAVPGEGEQLLAQPVPLLALPLARQERPDLVPPPQELVTVAPDRVLRVGELDLVGVPGDGGSC